MGRRRRVCALVIIALYRRRELASHALSPQRWRNSRYSTYQRAFTTPCTGRPKTPSTTGDPVRVAQTVGVCFEVAGARRAWDAARPGAGGHPRLELTSRRSPPRR